MPYDADAVESLDPDYVIEEDWYLDDDGTPDRGPVDPSGPTVIYTDQTPRAYKVNRDMVTYRPFRDEPSPYLRGQGLARRPSRPGRFPRNVRGFSNLPQAGSEAAGFGSDRLNAGEALLPGQNITSGNYSLILQRDGNLVLYKGGKEALWDSATPGSGAARVVMQRDGNLVIYNGSGGVLWASNTPNKPESYLRVQSDGNLVMYDGAGQPYWATNSTGGVRSHDMSKTTFLSKVGSVAKTALPIAQTVVSFVPGVGTGVNAAISAGVALAQGQPLTDAVVAGVKGMIPGGPMASQALETAYNVARGQNITTAAASALRNQLAKGNPLLGQAIDTGFALAHGQNIQEAAKGAVKTMATNLSPLASRALDNVGPVIGRVTQAVPVQLLSPGAAKVANALMNTPALRSLPVDEVAKRLHVHPQIARDGVASLVQSVARAGNGKLSALAPANDLARLIPPGTTFDRAIAEHASHAAPIAYSANARPGRREIRWHKSNNGRLAQVALGARGFSDAGALDPAAMPQLKQGSTGPNVVVWQGVIGVKADGQFGPQTSAATKAWQSAHGLVADGIVGPKTWSAAFPAMTPNAPTPLPTTGTQTSLPSIVVSPNTRPQLKLGSTGQAVKDWQAIVGTTVDGQFGPQTQAATKAWQSKRGLVADGIVGPKTWAAAMSSPAAPAASSPPPTTPTPGATPAPSPQTATVATYLVTSKDTRGLSGIAQDFTGNANRWKELAAANPQIKAPNYVIHAGDVLTLPASWGTKPVTPTAPTPSVPNIGAAIGQVVSSLPATIPTVLGGGIEQPVSLPPKTPSPGVTPTAATGTAPIAPAQAGAGPGGVGLLALIGLGLAGAQMKLF